MERARPKSANLHLQQFPVKIKTVFESNQFTVCVWVRRTNLPAFAVNEHIAWLKVTMNYISRVDEIGGI